MRNTSPDIVPNLVTTGCLTLSLQRVLQGWMQKLRRWWQQTRQQWRRVRRRQIYHRRRWQAGVYHTSDVLQKQCCERIDVTKKFLDPRTKIDAILTKSIALAGWRRIWGRNLPLKGTKMARSPPLTSGYLCRMMRWMRELEQLQKCKWSTKKKILD